MWAPIKTDPKIRKNSLISTSDYYATDAEEFRKDADLIAPLDPRLAARLRDVWEAQYNLAHLLNEYRRDLEENE